MGDMFGGDRQSLDHQKQTVFTFTAGAVSSLKFAVAIRPASCARPSSKRRRALSDVDGGRDGGRKKRRLRFFFCTSRLSRPFSQPATNIVNRSCGSKVAIGGGRPHKTGADSFRKAAILNRLRLRVSAAPIVTPQPEQKTRERLALPDILIQMPRHQKCRLNASPLGTSDYRALDREDDMWHDEDDEGGDQSPHIYSDFNIMDPVSDNDNDDLLDALDALDGLTQPDHSPLPALDEGVVGVLREKERDGDGLCVHVHVP